MRREMPGIFKYKKVTGNIMTEVSSGAGGRYVMCPHHSGPMPSLCVLAVVQSISPVQLSATPWTAAHQALLSSTVSWSLLRFMSIELLMLCNHFILCLPCSFCLQFSQNQIPMSQVFASVKVLSFSFNISTSNEYSGLISFGTD